MKTPAPIPCLAAAALLGLALSLGARGAYADVVVVVSAKSPVTSLSKGRIADIFLGRAIRFPDGEAAIPIDQAAGSAARDEFYLTYCGRTHAQVKAHWSKIIFTGRGLPPTAVENGEAVKRRVARDPEAIGYLDSSEVDASVRVVGAP